jgi:hypothetical protein
MSEDYAQCAAAFIRRFADMADRLALKSIALTSVHCDWSAFGCWEITACNSDKLKQSWIQNTANAFSVPGPDYIKVWRDGREGYVQIESSASEFLSSPNRWESQFEKAFAPGDESVFAFVEEYLAERLAR